MKLSRILFCAVFLTSTQGRAADATMTAFDSCLSQVGRNDKSPTDEDCIKAALKGSKGKADVALAVGKKIRGRFSHYVAMPFFREAAKLNPKKACDDSDLGMALMASLALPKDDARAADGRAVAFDHCWKTYKDDIVAELESKGAGSYIADNSCEGLKKKKALPAKSKACS